jgi:hypothetical protein
MQRNELGRELAGQLRNAERALDTAIALQAQLLVTMTTGRIQSRVSLVVGQPAIDGATATLALLSTARQRTIELHHGLRDAAEEMGVDYTLSGPGDDKPKDPPKTGVLAGAPFRLRAA